MNILYLTSEYPALSHTFILHEVMTLRKIHHSMAIYTASIRRPQNIESMGKPEQKEYRQTFYIQEKILSRGLANFFWLSIQHPIKMLRLSLCAAHWCLINGPKSLVKTLAYMLEAALLISHCHKKKLQHIHVHFANPAATVAMIASTFDSISFSMSAHGPDIFYDCRENLLQLKAKEAVFIRCISHYCVSQFMRIMPYEDWKKLHTVRCGVDIQSFMLPSSKISHEKIVDLKNKNEIQFLCVGRLCSAKAQVLLIKVFFEVYSELLCCNINAKLTIAGTFSGADKDLHSNIASYIYGEKSNKDGLCTFDENLQTEITSYQNLIKSQNIKNIYDILQFVGPVSQNGAKELYQKADIFVLPSVAEGVPVVLMEAMAMEIPCISTQITGIGELIDHEKNGLLCHAGDEKTLFKCMMRLALDSQLREKFAKEGRKTVVEQYNISTNVRDIATLYRNYIQ